jgi:general secretion pathway protein E
VSECTHFPDIESVERVIAGKQSWPTMAEDAVGKFRQGITTRQELDRVFGSAVEPFLEDHER